MTEQVAAEGTTEYVTQKSLDVLLQTLVDRLDEANQANQERVDEVVQSLERKIEQGKADNLTTMQRMMDDKLAKEREQRQNDIAALGLQLQKHLDSKLDEKFSPLSQSFAEIKGFMTNIQDTLKVRDDKDAAEHKRLEERIDARKSEIEQHAHRLNEVQNDVELVTTSQASLMEKASRLQTTIHGDPENKDDAPSLFKMMGELKEQVNQGFTNVGSRLDLTTDQIGKVRADVARIQEERAQEKARWQTFRSDLKALGKWLIGTAMGRIAIGAILGSVAIAAIPELRPPVIEALIKLIQQSGGQ